MSLTAFVILAAIGSIPTGATMDTPITDTRIPFYTGNLSVEKFMQLHGTHTGNLPADSDVSADKLELYRRIGVQAVCDYPAWALVEQQEGAWDWSYYRENCRRLREAGMGYTFACWVHFPPQWYLQSERMVPYRESVLRRDDSTDLAVVTGLAPALGRVVPPAGRGVCRSGPHGARVLSQRVW